jgi:hypothetical protein
MPGSGCQLLVALSCLGVVKVWRQQKWMDGDVKRKELIQNQTDAEQDTRLV